MPLTAHDFVWTGNFIMSNDISAWSDGYRYTESIEATDDRTIVWKTTRPTLVPGLPGYNLILPEHVWGDISDKEIKEFKNFPDPVVSGPFNLAEWKQGEYWTMTSRPDYWQGAPMIDEIIFRIYNSNEVRGAGPAEGRDRLHGDPTSDLYEAVQGRPGISTAESSAEAFWQLSFNLVDDPESTANPPSATLRCARPWSTPSTVRRSSIGCWRATPPRIHADRAGLRLLALGAAARGVPRLRPRRGEPPPRRSRLPRHRWRRRP